jgi:hypothetical protein
MSMASSDDTVEILKEIRDEIRRTNQRLDTTNGHLDVNNRRLDAVETTLLILAAQHRFVVRYTQNMSERDDRMEPRLKGLETRVGKLESE